MKIQRMNKQNYIKTNGNIKTKTDREPVEMVSLGSTEKTPDFLKLGNIKNQTAAFSKENTGRVVNGAVIGALATGIATLSGAPVTAVAPFGLAGAAAGALTNDAGFSLGAVVGSGITSGICISLGANPIGTIITSGVIGTLGGFFGASIYNC